MPSTFARPLTFAPGIDRDGTILNRKSCTDGEWVRWYQGKPRKIGGYQLIIDGDQNIIRTLASSPGREINPTTNNKTGIIRVFAGQSNKITISDINYNSKFSSNNVTPTTNAATAGYFLVNQNNLWQFDSLVVAASADPESIEDTSRVSQHYTFAFVGQNAADVGSAYTPTGGIGTAISNGCLFYQMSSEASAEPGAFQPFFVTTPNKPVISSDNGQPIPPSVIPLSSTSTDAIYPVVSGGIVVVGAYLFLYGNDGQVLWSTPGNPSEFPVTQQAVISSSKVIVGKVARGGGTNSVLFWTMTSVVLMQEQQVVKPVPVPEGDPQLTINEYRFTFDTVRDGVSIMSASSVAQLNDLFFWVGANQFYLYNGTVQELPNLMNRKYFFDGINPKCTSKVWAMADPQYDEITWFYPRGEATECTHYVRYNVLDQSWSDGELSRSAGFSDSLFLYPILADSGVNAKIEYPQYGIWRHEIGNNAVYSTIQGGSYPIKSSFTTPVIMAAAENPDNDVQILVRRMEPDFRRTGSYEYEKQTETDEVDGFLNPMEFQILTRNYANSKQVLAKSIIFDEKTPYVNIVGTQGRQIQYKFISDSLDGSYQMGEVWMTCSYGDVRSG